MNEICVSISSSLGKASRRFCDEGHELIGYNEGVALASAIMMYAEMEDTETEQEEGALRVMAFAAYWLALRLKMDKSELLKKLMEIDD